MSILVIILLIAAGIIVAILSLLTRAAYREYQIEDKRDHSLALLVDSFQLAWGVYWVCLCVWVRCSFKLLNFHTQ